MAIYKAIGVMSGTSLDGVDLAYVEFNQTNNKWDFKLKAHESISYSIEWRDRLAGLMKADALSFVKAHIDYGKYTGTLIKEFINKHELRPDIIGVHGHTIFHDPKQGYTSQIGDGATIAALSQQLIACDFRSMDVARDGQGAPLVPIGDQMLFNNYDACINIGGFANISFLKEGKLTAYDIGPANIVLNSVSQQLGFEYDDKGQLAESGEPDSILLEKLNSLPYYSQTAPKSLGKEWVDEQFLPLLPASIHHIDLLNTLVEHISQKITEELALVKGKVLITGGGALNDYLIQKIKEKTNLEIVIPSIEIIEMKESIIFAFLAVLRMLNLPNILPQVTGASSASISGAMYDGR